MTKIQEFLSSLEDNNLIVVIDQVGKEFKRRILDLLIKNEITSYTFEDDIKDLPEVKVYDSHFNTFYIKVPVIGYTKDMIGEDKLNPEVYVLDEADKMYWGEDGIDLNTLNIIYEKLKEHLM